MRVLGGLFILMTVILVIGIFGCERSEMPSTVAPELADKSNAPTPDPGMQTVSFDTTCSSVDCIEDFFDDYPCGNVAILRIEEGSYSLSGVYPLDNCPTRNWVEIRGTDAEDRPTLNLTSCVTDPVYHASLFIQENVYNTNVLEDLIINHGCYLEPNCASVLYMPGVQLYLGDWRLKNVKFTGSGTTHFSGTYLLEMDGVELASAHDYLFGDEDWCCLTPGDCGVPPGVLDDGSEIKNSTFYGSIRFDHQQFLTGHSDTTFFTDNDLITNLVLDAEVDAASSVVVYLDGNVFADRPSNAIVKIRGDYEVIAAGNTTQKGPCYANAVADFNTTNADRTNALTLESWVHDGHYYEQDEIVITDVETGFPYGCLIEVTWETNNYSSSKVYFGSKCTSLTEVATGDPGTSHSVFCDVTGFRGRWAFKVESANACDTATSNCSLEYYGSCVGY